MRWMEHVACMGEIRSVYKVFLTKRSLEQLQCRQSNNFEVYCEDTEWEVAECIWLRTEAGGGLMFMQYRNFRSVKG